MDQIAQDPWSLELESIDPSQSQRFQNGTHWEVFARLRKENPVHYCSVSDFGPYWSITSHQDIIAVDSNHRVFSSYRNIIIGDQEDSETTTSFIKKDEPEHGVQRKAVSPAVSPGQIAKLEALVRERTVDVLEHLPKGETFDWVERVSIELTTRMLATLFDFPYEDRHLLAYWSDVATATARTGNKSLTQEERMRVMGECLEYFENLWEGRSGSSDGFDFISLLARNPETKSMVKDPSDFLGNLMLLIVGGNDTTRNSMTGGLVALNRYPDQYEKLQSQPDLIPNTVSEMIRWQTPVGHMRRTALQDVEIGGKLIRKGEKVVMWYVSGNRDEAVFENADAFDISRKNARNHVSFGFGVHRCMGNRIAELQLKILWQEITKRFQVIELAGEPERVQSNFLMGYSALPVVINS